MNAIETLVSVLCDPEGKCCISGSDDDRRLIDSALAELTQAAQEDSVLEDAARYRFIRDVPYSDDVRSVLVHQQNAAMDRVIDAARAAQEGFNHDN